MHGDRVYSAYRLIMGIAILYVVWTIIPWGLSYANLVAGGVRRQQAQQARETTPRPTPPRGKMTAANLEAALRHANRLGPDAQLRCQPNRGWDYVCSYLPTALPSPKRLQFGVNVDATRWVKVSPVVPVGTRLAEPQ
jgi:hypothetical protein